MTCDCSMCLTNEDDDTTEEEEDLCYNCDSLESECCCDEMCGDCGEHEDDCHCNSPGYGGASDVSLYVEAVGKMDDIDFTSKDLNLTEEQSETLIYAFYGLEMLSREVEGSDQVARDFYAFFETFGHPKELDYSIIEKLSEEGYIMGIKDPNKAGYLQGALIFALSEWVERYFVGALIREARYHYNTGPISSDGPEMMRRSSAIYEGYTVEEKLKLMRLIQEMFDGNWSDSYGGDMWADITGTYISYLEGDFGDDAFTSSKMLIDRAFSLEHNTGSFLNKSMNIKDSTAFYFCHNMNASYEEVRTQYKYTNNLNRWFSDIVEVINEL